MKRAWLIVISGLVVALAAYAGIYFAGTANQRALEQSNRPVLAWLKEEYHLNDEQFGRVCRLNQAYQMNCAQMCREIDAENTRIKSLLAATNAVTPEIKEALARAGQIRAECQTAMLEHFYEVAGAMPPEEGRRYLAWVQQETLMPAQMWPDHQPMARHAQ